MTASKPTGTHSRKRNMALLIEERNELAILILRRALRPTKDILRRLDKLDEMIERRE